MASRYLLESGAPDGYLLEDGSGVLILDQKPALYSLADFAGAAVGESGMSVTERIVPWGAIK